MEQERKQPKALSKKQYRLVSGVIDSWEQAEIIDAETSEILRSSIAPINFDWKSLAKYSFIVALCCALVAGGAVLADKVLLTLLEKIFNAPPSVKALSFTVVAAGFFYYGLARRRTSPEKVFSNEAILFTGVISLAAAVAFLGVAVDTGTGHYSILFLLASILYSLLGFWFPSKQIWIFGLLSLGAWMGTETGYMSGSGMYFLGMNYPLRFALFGVLLTGAGIWGHRILSASRNEVNVGELPSASVKERFVYVSPQTKVVGMLNLFIALWIMSIFGNYGDMSVWENVRQYELLHWSVLFGLVAAVAIWYGLKEDDGVARGFGLTFLFINLYTRFFEYLWDATHKAIFFALLAVSFWILGANAEKIWRYGERRSS